MNVRHPSRRRAAAGAIGLAGAQRWRGRRIGLLGGSFNPAHTGHLHISRQAMARLRLDGLWWLVSPQNPLKAPAGMAPAQIRLASARRIVRDRRILPSLVEAQLGTRFTIDTVTALQRLHRQTRFIFLVGADNIAQLHRWKRWQALIKRVPIAVVGRPGYAAARWSAPAVARNRSQVLPEQQAQGWADHRLPVIVFLTIPRNRTSATAIRAADPHWADRLDSPKRTQSVGKNSRGATKRAGHG